MRGTTCSAYAILILCFCYTVYAASTDACNAAGGKGGWMGDGACDFQNIIPECDWDDGDCYKCTCVDQNDFVCGTDGFFCVDPDVLDDDRAICKEITTSLCPADGKRKWVVENTTQVQTLAEAMNCSGGIFDVEWNGTIVMDTEIVVTSGTVLNITGSVGSSAVLDGGGSTRLFRVADAYLQLNDVQVRNGSATFGGAIAAIGSTVILNRTSFIGNTATNKSGGAMFVYGGSHVFFHEETDFFNNTSGYEDGALFVANSSVFWDGVSDFSGNSAARSGGALCAVVGSTVCWNAKATFKENSALNYNGGALSLEDGSNASWSIDAFFSINSAQSEGGAIYVDLGSNASWSGPAYFSGNTANFGGGGAISIEDFSTVTLSGETEFMGNVCGMQGGAVSSKALDANTATYFGNQKSVLFIHGNTIFADNNCKSNGGGLAVLNGLSVIFENANITFFGNTADVAGGAVFISASGTVPTFVNTSFRSNSAEIGGGVYVTGSATSLNEESSATFDGCRFSENKAEATGGAIESATGTMTIKNTSFKGNKAGVGGALRLAGATSLDGCMFEENISNLDSGQAISMIGYELDMKSCEFRDNAYACVSGTFLNESGTGNRFSAVCSGCDNDECPSCTVDKRGDVSTCSDVIEHSTSPGGNNVTLMTLVIDPGYWRATNESTKVFECYNNDACNGGLTGSLDYCSEGYNGAYCSVCIDGYVKGPGFTCTDCSENARGIAVSVITVIVPVAVAFAVIKYVMLAEIGRGRGFTARVLRRIPLQSVKTVIVAWQILIQFSTVADVTYPGVYQEFLNAAEVLNFDLSWMISAGCFVAVDFHGKLVILTLGPILVMLLLSGTYTHIVRRHRASREALKIVRHKHVSVVLLVLFLVYSSASSTIFQMFDCDSLDDGKVYLRADYNIECDGDKHKCLMIYAGFMILLYPVGIPGLFAFLLFRNRHVLVDEARRTNELSVRSISDLWKPYKPSRFYYEVIECGRRIVLTGVILIVENDSAAQIVVALTLAFVFTVISEGLAPYESQIDAWVSRLGHAVVVSSMYYALLLKVDVSKETHTSQNVFEIFLVVTHVAMIVVVIFEAIATGFSFTQVQVEDPLPRFRPARVWAVSRSIRGGISRFSDEGSNSDNDEEIELKPQTRLQSRTWMRSLQRPRILCGGDF